MGFGVRGDFSKLVGMTKRIEEIQKGQLRQLILANLAEEVQTQIRLGFERSRDPFGAAWKPLKRKRRRDAAGTKGTPLKDTGRLRNSFTRRMTATGFEYFTNVTYAPVHQFGHTFKVKERATLREIAGKRRGRFVSGRRAAKAALKGKFFKVAMSKKHEIVIPPRPMVPFGQLGPIWKPAMEAVMLKILAAELGTR